MPRITAAHEAEKRQHILAAARRVFVAKGFHEASIDDLVAESGVSVGAIYNYYGGKDQLIHESILAAVNVEADAVLADTRFVGTARDKMERAIRGYVDYTIDAPGAAAFLVQCWALASQKPLIRDLLVRRRERTVTVAALIGREGVETGELPGRLRHRGDGARLHRPARRPRPPARGGRRLVSAVGDGATGARLPRSRRSASVRWRRQLEATSVAAGRAGVSIRCLRRQPPTSVACGPGARARSPTASEHPRPAMDNGRAMNVGDTRSMRVPAGVPAGVLATITMDVALVAAGRFGGRAFISDRLDVDVIGRWAAGLGRGRWHHGDITSEPAQRGELALGLLTHYATGIILTQAFLLLPRRGKGRPSLAAGTAFGIATSALPLLVMFPSMGYGWFGLRSGDSARLDRIMLLGHTAFGVGIGLWAPRFAERRPSRSVSRGPGCLPSGVRPARTLTGEDAT